jgi:hypothetical protein
MRSLLSVSSTKISKSLDPIPPYTVIREAIRKISRDSYVSYNGNRYSVPYIYAGREARVQIEDRGLIIFVGSEKVCEHVFLTGSHRISPTRSISGDCSLKFLRRTKPDQIRPVQF